MERKTIVRNKSNTKDGIYIGRGSIFGNPWGHKKSKYDIEVVGSRKEAVDNYRFWLSGERFADFKQNERHKILNFIEALRGETLLCYCYPDLCHGDVLVEILESKK